MDILFKEMKKLAITLASLDLLIIVVGIILNSFNMSLILGIVLGNVYTVLNFALLYTVVEKALGMPAHLAKRHIQTHYFIRLIMSGAVLAVGFLVDSVNGWCVVVSLLAPKITYTVIGFYLLFKDTYSNKKQK